MEMTRRLLLPETYDEIINREQPTVPQLGMDLMAKCEAYASLDRWTAYLLKTQKHEEAQKAAQARDRKYAELLPMLNALRKSETAPGEGAVS